MRGVSRKGKSILINLLNLKLEGFFELVIIGAVMQKICGVLKLKKH